MEARPSALRDLLDVHSITDIRILTKLKVGREHTRAVEQFQVVATVVSKALGGKSSKSVNAVQPKTFEEAESVFAGVFGKK